MASLLNPYITLGGEARDAVAFYARVLGGEPSIMTYADSGFAAEAGGDPSEGDKVMHSCLESPSGLALMVADAPGGSPAPGAGNVSISISGDDEAQLRGYWDGLAEGATIIEPLTQAPWGDSFGMLTDRFGVTWMINISAPAA
ncbi:VOC family protein [Actinotalea caeni]|uniref:VOC family protein n=1 Tax=Actinotalea caeni TaxID=1348467 RepID=UPI0012E26537|nr:VOC family protein [Actinotalea caeni]